MKSTNTSLDCSLKLVRPSGTFFLQEMPPEVFPRRMRADGEDGEGLHSLEYSMNVCGEARGERGSGGSRREGGREGGDWLLYFVFLKANHIYGEEGATPSFSENVSYISYIEKFF